MQVKQISLCCFQKAANVLVDHTHFGKLFHTVGPATTKLHFLIVLIDIVIVRRAISLADHIARVDAL